MLPSKEMNSAPREVPDTPREERACTDLELAHCALRQSESLVSCCSVAKPKPGIFGIDPSTQGLRTDLNFTSALIQHWRLGILDAAVDESWDFLRLKTWKVKFRRAETSDKFAAGTERRVHGMSAG